MKIMAYKYNLETTKGTITEFYVPKYFLKITINNGEIFVSHDKIFSDVFTEIQIDEEFVKELSDFILKRGEFHDKILALVKGDSK